MMRLALAAAALALSAATAEAAERVVVAGGALTEIVFALGAEGRLVGVDTTSRFPDAAGALDQVGYFRQLSAEGVLSLAPDLVLAVEGSGPAAALDQIRSAGVAVEIVPEDHSPEGVLDKIARVTQALGADQSTVGDGVGEDFAAISGALAGVAGRPRVLFVMGLGAGVPIAGGSNTAAEAMIRLAGGENAVVGLDGDKPLSPEGMLAAAPEVIVVPDHLVAESGGLAALREAPAFAGTPAAASGRVVAVDVLAFLGFGPRTPRAVRDLAIELHPGWTPPALPDRPWAAGGR